MSEVTRSLALAVLDEMIACAEAACERCRLAASKTQHAPPIVAKRKAAQLKAERTLFRLRAQRADVARSRR